MQKITIAGKDFEISQDKSCIFTDEKGAKFLQRYISRIVPITTYRSPFVILPFTGIYDITEILKQGDDYKLTLKIRGLR